MIVAEAQQRNNLLVLYFRYPNGSTVGPVTARNESDARRLVYFHNRVYINDKLKAYLNMRLYAYQVAGLRFTVHVKTANDLLLQLTVFDKTSMHRICQWVLLHEDAFKLIAPREASKHHKFYASTIAPIMEFCREMEAVHV